VSASADVSVTFKDELQLGLGLPQPLAVDIAVDPLSGGITELPKISIGVDPVTVEPITLNPLTIEPLTINLGPVDLSLSFKEIPSVRVHLPAHFSLGLTVCGRERFCARLCGEAQVITEPYEPNSCEQCEDRTQRGHAAYEASA
jgi:hypothetical protein